jgi:hypothetical protein
MRATFLYQGLPDYWGGDGRRWDDDAGCLFYCYDNRTTVRELIDGLVADFNSGGDCDSFPEDVGCSDVRAALLDMLSPKGLGDYHGDRPFEGAVDVDPDQEDLPAVIVLLELN